MKMGWGPVVVQTNQSQPWYKRHKRQLKCAHCGALVRPKGRYEKIQLFLILVAMLSFSSYVSPGCIDSCSFVASFVGMAAGIILVVNAVSKKFELVN